MKSSGSPIASLRTLSDNLVTDPILWTEVFTKEKIAAKFVKPRSFVGEDDTISLASSVTGKDIEEDTSKAEGAKEGPKQFPLSTPRSELDQLRPKFKVNLQAHLQRVRPVEQNKREAMGQQVPKAQF